MSVDDAQTRTRSQDSVAAQPGEGPRERLRPDLEDAGQDPLLDVERAARALHPVPLAQEAGNARDRGACGHRAVAAERGDLLQEELDDYRNFAVPFVWVIDPRTRLANTYGLANGYVMQRGLSTRNPDIELPLEKLFE